MRRTRRDLVILGLLAGLLAAVAAVSGCFVEGRCLGRYDCGTAEYCLSGECISCRSAAECTGLLDQNPHSPTYGESIEIAAFRGDVVLVYLANAG